MGPKVAILVGKYGRGSNMEALVRAMRSGQVQASPWLVLAGSDSAPALTLARELGVTTRTFGPSELAQAVVGADWLCLAGYLSLIPAVVIEQMGGRILNIHPALLPKFGGKGMYGSHVHEAVIRSGERESGCTVHRVTAQYDEGEIIVQLRCPVQQNDTPETLAARVLALEHKAYPMALAQVLSDG
ncbi:MAG: phosphoribosylglycinamide formyltransferase [Fimbriimonadaceae bacterium]|nr:phosphoribosylglycinamide formyltransferase [Fimbriimonadaceae bacterium]